ncbi:hypothetical protein D3C85_16060 [compost metagenome]
MSDNQLLVIVAATLIAVALIMRPFIAMLFRRAIVPVNPFMVILVEFPVGSLLLYSLLYVTYVMFFTHRP